MTVPVGIPVPGGLAATVAVKVTDCQKKGLKGAGDKRVVVVGSFACHLATKASTPLAATGTVGVGKSVEAVCPATQTAQSAGELAVAATQPKAIPFPESGPLPPRNVA